MSPLPKDRDDENVVYVAVARELLPQLSEWSEPVRVRVASEEDGMIVLHVEAYLPPKPSEISLVHKQFPGGHITGAIPRDR